MTQLIPLENIEYVGTKAGWTTTRTNSVIILKKDETELSYYPQSAMLKRLDTREGKSASQCIGNIKEEEVLEMLAPTKPTTKRSEYIEIKIQNYMKNFKNPTECSVQTITPDTRNVPEKSHASQTPVGTTLVLEKKEKPKASLVHEEYPSDPISIPDEVHGSLPIKQNTGIVPVCQNTKSLRDIKHNDDVPLRPFISLDRLPNMNTAWAKKMLERNECVYCQRIFNNLDDLELHLKTTDKHRVFFCCGKIFMNSKRFAQHRKLPRHFDPHALYSE